MLVKFVEFSNLSVDGDRTVSVLGTKLPWPFPLVWQINSSDARIFGICVYASDNRFIELIHGILKRVDGWIWQIKYRVLPKYQYHLVRTGLKPGNLDHDRRMLHACMRLLCEYVDDVGGIEELEKWTNELRREALDDSLEKEQQEPKEVFLEVYRWWKVERPALESREELLSERLDDLGYYEDLCNYRPWKPSPRPLSLCPWYKQILRESKIYDLNLRRSLDEIHKTKQEMDEINFRIHTTDQEMLMRLVEARHFM